VPIVGDRPEINIETVIYATDFSPCSENAGSYAKLLARDLQAKLIIAHAVRLSRPAKEVELGESKDSQTRAELESLLAARVRELTDSHVHAAARLLEGNPHEAIPALAEQHAPALIVLGTHGAGRMEHGLIGSVAEKILRSTRWPCWTVGPQTPSPSGAGLPFRHVLYATDFSPAAANAAAYAVAFAQSASGDVDALNVVPGDASDNSERMTALKQRYARALEELVPGQSREFCSPHTFVEFGSAHARILEHVRKHNTDLLVLGVHRSSHLGLEMRTSGVFRLIADAPCPVLTVIG